MTIRIMRKMKGRCAVMLAAAGITLLVPGLGSAAPAGAAAATQTNFPITANTTDWICNPNATEGCWEDVGGPGSTFTNGDDVADNDTVGTSGGDTSVLLDTSICPGSDGKVSTSPACPFVDGSGVNQELVNHTIVVIDFNNGGASSGNFCADSSEAFSIVALGGCSGGPAAYVVTGNGSGLISVGATNEFFESCQSGPPGGCATASPVTSVYQCPCDIQSGPFAFTIPLFDDDAANSVWTESAP